MSQPIRHKVAHNLSPELAQLAAKKAAEVYLEKYKDYIKGEWESTTLLRLSLTVGKAVLDGMMTVGPKAIGFSISGASFLQRMIAGQAFKAIDTETQIWLDKAGRGEL